MRQDAMTALAEQRRFFRKRVFRTAQIVLSEKAPKLECNALDLSAQGVRLRLSTTYGIPHEFEVIIDGRRKPSRSIWRTRYRNRRDVLGRIATIRRFYEARKRHCSADRATENGRGNMAEFGKRRNLRNRIT